MRSLAIAACAAALAGCAQHAAPEPMVPPVSKGTPPPSPAEQVQPTAKDQKPKRNPLREHQLADLKRAKVLVGEKEIQVWIMDNNAKRAEGMMFLSDEEVKDQEGMLFVFKAAKPQGFWMQNTYIPLDIVYISSHGKVLNIQKAKPLDETTLPSSGPAQYVLELKQGMAAKLGIKTGTVLQLPKDVKATE